MANDLDIPFCGYYTREQGILLKIWCYFGTGRHHNEEVTALCYIVNDETKLIQIRSSTPIKTNNTNDHKVLEVFIVAI